MDTSEKIVETYLRFCLKACTISNLKCSGNKEIDLLAIDKHGKRYHVEVSIKTRDEFAVLRGGDYRVVRDKARRQRHLTYFKDRKFNDPTIKRKLKDYGFTRNNYQKVIVSNGWENGIDRIARRYKIELWHIKDILQKLIHLMENERLFIQDDILRLFQLLHRTGIRIQL